MNTSDQTIRTRIARGREIAQHISDPSVRCALLNLMKELDGDLVALHSRAR